MLGIHIEGPFLNEHRKGIHDSEKIRELDEEGFAVLTSLKRGRTLVTVAPECTTPEMIKRLVAAGVIVSAGHSNGRYADMAAAIDAGLTGVTHLFNAMSPLTGREPGVVGAALESDKLWCGIIVDGHHVSPVTLKLALRCKSADKFMLVTDAMPSVGSATKDFVLQGKRISARGGVCVDSRGTLAGSDLDMASAVRNAIELLGVPHGARVSHGQRCARRIPALGRPWRDCAGNARRSRVARRRPDCPRDLDRRTAGRCPRCLAAVAERHAQRRPGIAHCVRAARSLFRTKC